MDFHKWSISLKYLIKLEFETTKQISQEAPFTLKICQELTPQAMIFEKLVGNYSGSDIFIKNHQSNF